MHHRLMKLTHYKLSIVANKCYMHMTSAQEADRHHLLDAVVEVLRVAGHLRTAGSACPHLLLSAKTRRHMPNTSPQFATLSCISIVFKGCCSLSGQPASCILMMVVLLDIK
jgi:hypothetical protein